MICDELIKRSMNSIDVRDCIRYLEAIVDNVANRTIESYKDTRKFQTITLSSCLNLHPALTLKSFYTTMLRSGNETY